MRRASSRHLESSSAGALQGPVPSITMRLGVESTSLGLMFFGQRHVFVSVFFVFWGGLSVFKNLAGQGPVLCQHVGT